jgi:hypothetical protein
MTANEIIARARSVSDLPASKFVSHQDELDSLNEAWKDLYSALIEADDDFYVTEVTNLTLNAGTAVAGTQQEYLVPMPTDVLKIRYLDYRGAYDWLPMSKFNLGMKDNKPGDPSYRLRGQNLWVIGGNAPATGLTMRLGYYPAVATITCPQAPLVYGTSYAPNLFTAIAAPAYAPYLQTMVYAYGLIITSENITNSTVSAPVALFTEATAVTNIVYYKGVLYWIRGGLIWYKATSLTAAFVAPTQATTPAAVVSFYISADTIYYTTATAIRSCDLTGGTDALVSATMNVTSVVVSGPIIIYRTTASFVGIIAPAVTLYASGIAKITSDGGSSNLLYILDNAGNIRKVTYNVTTGAIVTDETIDTGASDIGQVRYDMGQTPNTWIIPTLKANSQQLLGVDGTVNYNFSFPNNLVPEIMAWQSAVDYRTKQEAAVDGHLLKLGHPTNAAQGPATGLWARFEQSIKRDEYRAERIRNVYATGGYMR